MTQAVIRLAEDDPVARRLLLQVMAPILVKEMFRTGRVAAGQGRGR